jgi:hypothetical protein
MADRVRGHSAAARERGVIHSRKAEPFEVEAPVSKASRLKMPLNDP